MILSSQRTNAYGIKEKQLAWPVFEYVGDGGGGGMLLMTYHSLFNTLLLSCSWQWYVIVETDDGKVQLDRVTPTELHPSPGLNV